MQAIDNRIVSLVKAGVKPKVVAETLKREGIRTARGKVATPIFVQNRIQALRGRNLLNRNSNRNNMELRQGIEQGSVSAAASTKSKAEYTAISSDKSFNNSSYQNLATFVLNVANNAEWTDAKKVAVLKAWFA